MVSATGAEEYRSRILLPRLAIAASGALSSGLRAQDVQTTRELTAISISEQELLSGGCERLLVCGGGARNPLLMARLAICCCRERKCRPPMRRDQRDDMEALAFAWLARRTLAGLPGNLLR